MCGAPVIGYQSSTPPFPDNNTTGKENNYKKDFRGPGYFIPISFRVVVCVWCLATLYERDGHLLIQEPKIPTYRLGLHFPSQHLS